MVIKIQSPYAYGEFINVGDSGSSYLQDGDIYFGATGSFIDPYRYPVLQQHEVDDLWKCQSCRKVYRIADNLECESCGTSITEKSRFVLE